MEKSVYVEGIMESSLAPLIDRVMRDNRGIYVKSHPKGKESKPLIEVHLSTTMNDSKAEEKLGKAVSQLSSLIMEVGGLIVVVG